VRRDGQAPGRLQAQRQADRLVVGIRPEVKRRRELVAKQQRSQAETQELILLELQAIKQHLGIDS